jgi:hypothetical protein
MNLPSRVVAAISVALVLACAVLPAADFGTNNDNSPRDGDEREGPRVVLYERPGFRGDSIEVKSGEELSNLANVTFSSGRRANDAVSSIYIEPGAIVTANSDARFRGESLRLTRSVENLDDIHMASGGSWADAISSVKVEATAVVRPVRRGGGEREDREPRVILYREANFRGEFLEVFPGENYDNLNGVSFDGGHNANDAVSSIRVVGGVRLHAFSASNYREDSLDLTQDAANLAEVRRPADGAGTWSDCISSLRVERGSDQPDTNDKDSGGGRDRGRDRADNGDDDRPGAGRGPDRHAWRPAESEVFIGRLFRELLSRGPTELEVRSYREHMVEDGWTDDMVRTDVKQTREYRLRDADIVIARSYQELLGRKPDAEGLRHYRELVVDDGYSEQQVRERIRQSDEYRQRRQREADLIITRAFRDLLGRDPDAEGLQHYRQLVIERNFSEAQIRARIRDSEEFHAREREQKAAQADAMITRAYRDLLGRDPDPGGLAEYRRAVLERGLNERQVRDSIKGSDEYRARQMAPARP